MRLDFLSPCTSFPNKCLVSPKSFILKVPLKASVHAFIAALVMRMMSSTFTSRNTSLFIGVYVVMCFAAREAPSQALHGAFVPSSRRFLQPLQGLDGLAHQVLLPWLHNTLRLLHADLFLEISILKRCLHIHVMVIPLVGCYKAEEDANGGQLFYRSKGLTEVQSLNL